MSALRQLQTTPVEQIALWPLARVLPNPLNPRGALIPESLDELAASLREHGILTPLLAVPSAGEFVHLVAGHRRRAAAEMIGMRELPVIVHRFTPLEQLEIMLVENLQRSDLTPLQEARAYRGLIAEGLTKSDIVRRLSVSYPRVQQHLELLTLDETVQRAFDTGKLPLALIKSLARLTDHAEQRRMSMLALQRRLNAAELAECMGQQQSAEAKVTTAARQAKERRTSDRSSPVLPIEAHTRSEAAALLTGDAMVSFSDVRGALKYACDGCDEEQFPAICRACPMPQFIAAIVSGVRRREG